MKIIFITLISLGLLSCSQRQYTGDGIFSYHRTPFFGLLWPSVFEVKMSDINISKPILKTYNLSGLPIPDPRSNYRVYIVIPSNSLDDPDRTGWGNCRFEIKKNGVIVKKISSDFSKMINNRTRGENSYLNRLYINPFATGEVAFSILDGHEDAKLTFECSGFDDKFSQPVWAHILVRAGGK